MNLTNLTNLTNYDCNAESIDLSNYKWYNDKNHLDKIGINSDGTKLMHDSMLYVLKKFRMINKIINSVNTIQLIFKLDNKLDELKPTTKQPYFTDLIFGEKSAYIIFKYVEINKKMTFSHIVFNGKIFK